MIDTQFIQLWVRAFTTCYSTPYFNLYTCKKQPLNDDDYIPSPFHDLGRCDDVLYRDTVPSPGRDFSPDTPVLDCETGDSCCAFHGPFPVHVLAIWTGVLCYCSLIHMTWTQFHGVCLAAN